MLFPDCLSPPRFILASTSPRRKELISSVGWKFDVVAPRTEEQPVEFELPQKAALRFARNKALSVKHCCDAVCVGADTVVDVDGIIFGKPKNIRDSFCMLRTLSGRWHQVHTGIAVACDGEILADGLETTRVKFALLTECEIEEFVRSGVGEDKAGSYAIQGIGATMVERIEGCYYNVVGMPLYLLYTLFKKLGLIEIPICNSDGR